MTIYLSTVRTLFMYVNVIFFTIYIWYFQVLSNVEIVDVLYVDERQDTAKNGFVMLRIGKVWLHVIFEIFMK